MPDPDDPELEGVARDAATIQDVLNELEGSGFTGQFGADDGGEVKCFSCREVFDAAIARVEESRRLEGASDPDDMLSVYAIECPRCRARGTLLLKFGPTATDVEDLVAQRLDNAPPPEPDAA